MAQRQFIRANTMRLGSTLGVTIALAITFSTPLKADDTVVQGKPQRDGLVQERVSYADLNLRFKENQQVLISRVKGASRRVCNILYDGNRFGEFAGRCPHVVYRDARPQINLAIANARNGKQVAMSFIIAPSR